MNTTKPDAAKRLSPAELASVTDQEFAEAVCTWLYGSTGKDWALADDALRVGDICKALNVTVHVSPLIADGALGPWHQSSVGSIIFRPEKDDARWRRMTISEVAVGRGAKTSALMGSLLALSVLDLLGASSLGLARSSSVGDLVGNALACRQYGRKLSPRATGSTPTYWSAAMKEAEAASRKRRPRAWRLADRTCSRLTRAMKNDTVHEFVGAARKRSGHGAPRRSSGAPSPANVEPAIAAE